MGHQKQKQKTAKSVLPGHYLWFLTLPKMKIVIGMFKNDFKEG